MSGMIHWHAATLLGPKGSLLHCLCPSNGWHQHCSSQVFSAKGQLCQNCHVASEWPQLLALHTILKRNRNGMTSTSILHIFYLLEVLACTCIIELLQLSKNLKNVSGPADRNKKVLVTVIVDHNSLQLLRINWKVLLIMFATQQAY